MRFGYNEVIVVRAIDKATTININRHVIWNKIHEFSIDVIYATTQHSVDTGIWNTIGSATYDVIKNITITATHDSIDDILNNI